LPKARIFAAKCPLPQQHQRLPTATSIALLFNPTNPLAETLTRDVQEAARALGLQLHILHASTERDLDTVRWPSCKPAHS
jgi:ABC-type uncharacterized transport system substrate-binding protein